MPCQCLINITQWAGRFADTNKGRCVNKRMKVSESEVKFEIGERRLAIELEVMMLFNDDDFFFNDDDDLIEKAG